MTLQERLKLLRQEMGMSQEAMGAQGFVSVPGWVKIENGQRSPSDTLILRLVSWALREGHFGVSKAARVLEELLTLKYLTNRSAFVRRLARAHAEDLFEGTPVRLADNPMAYRPKPRRKTTRAVGD